MKKQVHYVQFGKQSDLNKKCLDSWEKHLPDYEITKWDDTNFDVKSNQFCKEALDCEAYAFAADFIRLKVLAEHGGISRATIATNAFFLH